MEITPTITQNNTMPKIPAIAMIKVLYQYSKAKGINLNIRNWDEITACYYNYCHYASKNN